MTLRCAVPAKSFIFGLVAIVLLVVISQSTRNHDQLLGWVSAASHQTDDDVNEPGTNTPNAIRKTSERLWRKTVEQRNKLRKKFPDIDFFPAHDQASYLNHPLSVWDLVPASYNCPWEVERIGAMGYGGKWVCGMSRYEKSDKPCIIYSFGLQNDSSFEQEMLERTKCKVWGYDLSADGFSSQLHPDVRRRTYFNKVEVAAHTEPEKIPPHYTIQDLMKQNNHDYIDILKMDIEYAEFNALSSLNGHTQAEKSEFPIGQLLVEFHLFQHQPLTLPIFLDWWESIEYRGLRPTWSEPNLLATSMGMEDRNARLAEYTMVNVLDRRSKLFE